MKESVLWIAGALAVCALGWTGWTVYQKKKNRRKETNGVGVYSKPTVETPAFEKAEPECSEQEQLLTELAELRTEHSLLRERKNCAVLFSDLTGGIQDFFAQERRSFSEDGEFCRCLVISAKNESLEWRIAGRKEREKPEPLSPEVKMYDADRLRELIRVEKSQNPEPVVDIPWNEVLDRVIPCLEKLLTEAEKGRAEACRSLLKELRTILAEYKIVPLWYQDRAVQENDKMKWDFVTIQSYGVPALYYHGEKGYIHIGASGCTGEAVVD